MICLNWHEFEKPNSYMIMDEVAIVFYVFGKFMEGRIGGNMYGRLIIAKEESWRRRYNAKIL